MVISLVCIGYWVGRLSCLWFVKCFMMRGVWFFVIFCWMFLCSGWMLVVWNRMMMMVVSCVSMWYWMWDCCCF